MTLEEAHARVELIRDEIDDPEGAHSEEDKFREDVLRYLSEVAPAELGELARIALSTNELDFPRWCA